MQSNGIAQLDNPLYPATLFGTFSQPVVIAASTEDDYFDLFIAVQAPPTSFSNSILSGAFTVGTLDFLNASASLARQGYFTLNADGQGQYRGIRRDWLGREFELRQQPNAECFGLHLCTLRHSRVEP